MKKKFLGRVLTMLLVASMVFTLLPAPAIAAGNWWWNNDEYTEEAVPTATTTADANYRYNIFFLDCGRKYYSVNSIKKLIDNAKAAGFNYIQLAVGNDGLRFLLDDMSLKVNGTTYSNENVRAAIHAGNEAYYNFDTDELTQSEMDEIIAYANIKSMGVIPCVNTPGHMDAILSAATSLTGTTCSYNGSARTIDVTNTTAVAFTQALLQKYITYFAGKSCQLFNMGADEYANDIYTGGSMGFGNLQSSGNYSYYVTYVNQVAAMIKNAGMKPMAFNDGIYFNNNTSSGEFDKDIIICYWSNGWTDYTPMPAATLASKGFKLVNTHGDYYWVIGKSDWQCSPKKASGFNYKEFQGGTIDSPAGSMFCIWGDYPGALTENQVIDQTAATIAAFKEVLPAATPDTTTPTPTPPDGGTTPAEETITVPVNGTKEITVDGNVTVTTGSDYNASIATYTSTTKTEPTTTETPVTSPTAQYNYIKDVTTGKYLNNTADWVDNLSEAAQWQAISNGTTYYLRSTGSPRYYIYKYSNNTWYASRSSYANFTFADGQFKLTSSPYAVLGSAITVETDSTPKTLVTFNGLAKGTTYVTIGGTKYTIIVTDKAPDNALTDNSITLEYWITNNPVYNNKNKSAQYQMINASSASIEQGVEIKSLAPEPAYSFFDGTVTVCYWQAVRLDSAHKQTNKSGVDQTAAGTTLTHVRYRNSAWQYKTLDGTWHYFESGDQLVAYYLQKTEVTKEITTYTKDWGYGTSGTTPDTSSGNGQAALTVAVVYPDGTVSPAEGEMYSKSTTIFNYWNDRNIGIVSPANNSDYDISKITVTDGARTKNTSANQWYTTDTITWEKKLTDDGKTKWYNEIVVWDEQTNAGTTPMVNGSDPSCKAVCTWSAKNTAKLVLIYLKPVVKETNLHLAYYDDTHNEQIIAPIDIAMTSIGTVTPTFTTALKDANGNEIGDTASWPGTTSGESSYLPDGAYVVNSSGVHQTFNKNLPTVPGVAPNYKSGVYKYNGADISNDGKTLTLHYVLDESKLTLTYVFDFGLPINIPVSDLVGDAASSVKTVYVGNTDLSSGTAASQHGKLTYNKSTQYITYEPTKAWTAQGLSSVTFKVEFTDETTQNFTIGVLPASNVLYEENFLTQSGESGLSWTKGTSTAPTTPQQTQKAKAGGNVFGYDDAYVPSDTNPVTGELGVWTATGLEFSKMTRALTTEFYGNGFDLIGNCGPDTGRVMIAFTKQGANVPCRVVMVNTRFNDSKVATTLHQVPWAHVELGVDDAMYKVEIFASGNETNSSSRTMFASGYAAETDAFDSILAAYGMSASDVEYINVADTITEPSAYAVSYASVAADVTADQTIEVDGFRVYRSTNNANYPDNEKNVTYNNILDVVKGEITAYTENGNGGAVQVTEYEKNGGPQNEIYLSKGQSVTFQVGTAPSEIQVSLRAVSDTTSWATSKTGDNPASITSNTEMYYPVTTNSDGSITIVNRGEGLLAIGNVKLPDGAVTQSASEMDKDVVLASVRMALGASGEGDTFDPAISAKVTTTRFIRSKVVTLTVSASADVEKLMVNGVELRPTNSWLVKMGWSDTYTYILTEKVQKNEIKTYEIVGYRADGAASAPIVVKSK